MAVIAPSRVEFEMTQAFPLKCGHRYFVAVIISSPPRLAASRTAEVRVRLDQDELDEFVRVYTGEAHCPDCEMEA